MNRRDSRDACVLLATLWATVAVQAQEVHKCTINGQVTYQAKPCPAGDIVLPTVPTPSDQELREARGDLSRQRWQAATGRLYQPVHAAPPPPPPPPPPPSNTSTTTIIVLPSNNSGAVIVRRTTHSSTTNAPPPPPANNCEKLNRDIGEATERRDQLKAPSELTTRADALARTEGDVARIRDLAQASNCKLTH